MLSGLNIRVILDIPCGDYNWAREIDWTPFNYIGADIVPDLVNKNRSLYASKSVEFQTIDILTDPLPCCDLVLCRDLFIHFPNELIQTALHKIRLSGAQYLLATQYEGVYANREIALGSFRPVNLMCHPFDLPEPEHIISDDDYLKLWGRTLALWRVENIPEKMS